MIKTAKELKQYLNRSFCDLVLSWFPDGKFKGTKEYQVLNPSRSDRSLGSMSINMNKCFGYDFATLALYDIIGIYGLKHSLSYSESVQELMIMYGSNIDYCSEHIVRVSEKKNLNSQRPNVALKPFQKHAMYHRHLGRPALVFEYRNTDDDLIGYTARFEAQVQGKRAKHILAMTWSLREGIWRWGWNEMGWNGTKPIYGIEKLQKNPEKHVLILEGEKTCDAAQRMFPDFICLSWRGGVGNVKRVDWKILEGRVVAIWADNDPPGIEAAVFISNALPSGRIISPPAWKPVGWDLGDAEDESIHPSKLLDYLAYFAPEFSK